MPHYHPGDAIASRCTKCNDVTGHVIVALVGDEIIKVECRACGSVHKYRPPEGATAQPKEKVQRVRQGTSRADAIRSARATTQAAVSAATSPAAAKTTGARAARAAEALENDWRTALATAPGCGEPKAYAMGERFAVDDVVDHPTFGNGVVRELLPPDKMRVLFRDGLRLLRCAC